MTMKDETWKRLEWLLARWIDANDLDMHAIEDPIRAAAFGWYVAKHNAVAEAAQRDSVTDGDEIGEWDVRTFVEYFNRQMQFK